MVIDSVVDFMTEVNDFLMYVTGIPQARLFRGNQSREVLPRENDYIVYTPISQKRIGTNVAILHAENVPDNENAPNTDTKLLQVHVQVDCYGSKAFAYAESIETFAGALRCNEWLQQSKMGMRVLYASNPIDATLVDDTRQYILRWVVTLSIEFEVSVTDNIPWIEDVVVIPNPQADLSPPGPDAPSYTEPDGTKLKNVDIEYKGVI
jgi:hypothetical protein